MLQGLAFLLWRPFFRLVLSLTLKVVNEREETHERCGVRQGLYHSYPWLTLTEIGVEMQTFVNPSHEDKVMGSTSVPSHT